MSKVPGTNEFAVRELSAFQGNFFCQYSHRRTDGLDTHRHQWVSASKVRRICLNCHTIILNVDDVDGFNWNTESYVIREMP